jgi:tripartite-type tricarboxylate transporter receptor subunit TctC
MKNVLIKILAGSTVLLSASMAQAAWPDDKPIEIIVGFAAGGETDIMTRGLAPFIGKHLGGKATLIVVNKVGASGEIGNAYLQRSQPDGYTLGVVNVPPLLFVTLIKKHSTTQKSSHC